LPNTFPLDDVESTVFFLAAHLSALQPAQRIGEELRRAPAAQTI